MVITHRASEVLAEHAPLVDRVLAVTTDARGQVTWVSPAIEDLVGHPADELVGGEPPLWLFDADEVERRTTAAGVRFGPQLFVTDPREFGRRAVRVDLGAGDRRRSTDRERAQARPAACDWTLLTRDGDRVVVSVTVRTLRDDTGRRVGYLALGVDVTEERRTRRLLAEALQREQAASRRLEELDQVRNDFVATASHELRTPLTSIGGYLDLIESHLDGSPQSHRLLDRVRRNTSRIQHLADELLLLSTLDAPCPEGDQGEVVDLRHVLEGAGDVLEALALHHGGTTRLEPTDGAVLVRADRHQLERVVVHLVDNALKFGGSEVVCRLRADGDDALIEVSDNGAGIAPADRDHVFDRFFRGAAAVRNGVPGAGLGLSVARTLVERHGGAIALHSNVPHGTVVRVRLPRLEEESIGDHS